MAKRWSRAIILVDMNAFFASIEQLDQPLWRQKPVAVTNGAQGSCIITCSYEARRFGIKTGMRLWEARRRCPQLIQAPSRPARYMAISKTIMQALENITPDIEVFSVDEAFLDVSRCQRLYTPAVAAKKVQETIRAVSGLPCSVGVSGDKTTAKYAAKLKKPNGLTIIPPWEAKAHLATVPVNELCGIGPGITRFLAKYGVIVCGDMEKLPIGILAQRFGNLGRRLWYMCLGADPAPVQTRQALAKSLGHGKILPPGTQQDKVIRYYFLHLSERLAARLRRKHMTARLFFVAMKSSDWGWLADKVQLVVDTDNSQRIYKLTLQLLSHYPAHGEVRQLQITALDPRNGMQQLDLFESAATETAQPLNQVQDKINQQFNRNLLKPARLLTGDKVTEVIPPVWQPDE